MGAAFFKFPCPNRTGLVPEVPRHETLFECHFLDLIYADLPLIQERRSSDFSHLLHSLNLFS